MQMTNVEKLLNKNQQLGKENKFTLQKNQPQKILTKFSKILSQFTVGIPVDIPRDIPTIFLQQKFTKSLKREL